MSLGGEGVVNVSAKCPDLQVSLKVVDKDSKNMVQIYVNLRLERWLGC